MCDDVEISLRATNRARELFEVMFMYLDGNLSNCELDEVESELMGVFAEEEARTAEEVEAFKEGSRLLDELCVQVNTLIRERVVVLTEENKRLRAELEAR